MIKRLYNSITGIVKSRSELLEEFPVMKISRHCYAIVSTCIFKVYVNTCLLYTSRCV